MTYAEIDKMIADHLMAGKPVTMVPAGERSIDPFAMTTSMWGRRKALRAKDAKAKKVVK